MKKNEEGHDFFASSACERIPVCPSQGKTLKKYERQGQDVGKEVAS